MLNKRYVFFTIFNVRGEDRARWDYITLLKLFNIILYLYRDNPLKLVIMDIFINN